MNTNTQTHRAVEQDKPRFLKLISNSASATIGVTLLAVGLLIAVHRVNAAGTVSATDRDFMLSAAQGGMTEVQMGNLAYEKGMSVGIKEFGQRMVKDHTSINADLKALAAQKNVTLPDGLDEKHLALVSNMSTLSSTNFDNAYTACMIKDHKMVLKAFKAESAGTTDMDVKNFVDQTIPIVEDHLKSITALQK